MNIITDTDIYIQFGKRLANVRQDKGLSQNEFAKVLGIPQSTYAGYEVGKRKIPLELIERVANALEVSSTFLIAGKDVSPPIADPYTPQEQTIIKKYRTLDERGKKAVDDTLEREYEFVKPKILIKGTV
ncbi:MAG TPA: helix-turn-helix transcriptional regulator [Methylomusa anaerophila]|uniref:Antitoxin PezA n=1 Tax=Methylomusa anaerophila TaxID=1930071 RepID=A0A348AL47_9FIRM|nr:helix-turn-helix transcriptional regulator [Methylomusa anaerophila]BBB91795.1 antitoxin PezA [Methylomusa anaerophila]HML88469.1 helix-turn-helix transcriptional regulator [Methylomusa anaerophila]